MKSMPWKNGGGTTLEVAISPTSAQVGNLDFNWRVSVALIESEGPFSKFPGFDRQLLVWRGEGLNLNGVGLSALETFEFAGEEDIHARLSNGSVEDYGVIFRRGQIQCATKTYRLKEEEVLKLKSAGDSFILCAKGELRVGEFYLNPGDVVHAKSEGDFQVTALAESQFVVSSLSQVPNRGGQA